MIVLLVLGAVVLFLVMPFVLQQVLYELEERTFFLLYPVESTGGPFRESSTSLAVPFKLPIQVRGAVAFCFFFLVLGLLMITPVLFSLATQWGWAWLVGLPGLALAAATSVIGFMLLQDGPKVAVSIGIVGLAQVFFGTWLIAIVVTVTNAQYGPVSGLMEETVAHVFSLAGERLRENSWSTLFFVKNLGILPILYGTASLFHGVLLILSSYSLSRLRFTQIIAD